jgi:signal peptidase II
LKIFYVSFVIVLIDQITKVIIKGIYIPFMQLRHDGMYHGQRIPVIGDFFRITFIENPGMAFGIDPGVDFKLYLSLFSLIASIGLGIYLYVIRHESTSLRLALAFILGGAVGNLIDRMFYGVFYNYAPLFHGKVVDFLDFDFFNVTIFGREYDRWPIFNIADSAVTVGVLILIIFYQKHKKEEEAKEQSELKDSSDSITPAEAEINASSETDIDQSAYNNSAPESADTPSGNDINNEEDNENGESDKGKNLPL